jgi:hypothetical protein
MIIHPKEVQVFVYATIAQFNLDLDLAFYILNFHVNDYIHVVDLADGHTAALRILSDLK